MSNLLSQPKDRRIATLLAWSGAVTPFSGLHKFYLGQPVWGVVYLLLSWTMIPKFASAIEGIWYLLQNQAEFDSNFNGALPPAPPPSPPIDAGQVEAVAAALRQLDQLRKEGLMSEYEFEQKRRQLLDRIA
ncbi:NINE protein [Microcoleus sp. FACHB-1515]|uniref:NINE protein n=1 Tax=Microcoleus sp. FACHB-1515 TaxID=2692821 RepID=UPI00329B96D6